MPHENNHAVFVQIRKHPQVIDSIDIDESVYIGKQLNCVICNLQPNTDTAPFLADFAHYVIVTCFFYYMLFFCYVIRYGYVICYAMSC